MSMMVQLRMIPKEPRRRIKIKVLLFLSMKNLESLGMSLEISKKGKTKPMTRLRKKGEKRQLWYLINKNKFMNPSLKIIIMATRTDHQDDINTITLILLYKYFIFVFTL